MSLDLTDDKSTLVQVMAWCHQATGMVLSIKYRHHIGLLHGEFGLLRLNKIQDMIWNMNTSLIIFKKNKHVNSLALGRFWWNFRWVIFKQILVIDGWVISSEIALRWMSLALIDDKSTLVQVMAWCCQATSHYLSQCWHRSMSPNGITRPQWGKKNSAC